MGYDIKAVCEYKIRGRWIVGQKYVVTHDVDGSATYDLVDPVVEFRNYNLFRPLANIHNTKEHIARQAELWDQSVDQLDRSTMRTTRIRGWDQYYPETSEPTDVVDADRRFPKDVNPITRMMIDSFANSEDDVYSITLDKLVDFISQHHNYRQLDQMIDRCYSHFNRCNKICVNKTGNTLPLNHFRVVYGFEY